jgi:hypothetical protein
MTHAYCVIKPGQLLDPPSIRRSAMAACVAKGITYCHIGVPWSTFQSAVGGSTAAGVDSLRLYLDDVQASGMKAIVEVALHYAPAFVTSGVEQFKDQSANLWSDTGASGQNVRNWQWTTLGRTYVADLFNHLRISGIASHPAVAGARMGGGYRGEAHYAPVSGGTTPWWIFGASLQSGAGLSSDMTVCPFPGRTPAWDGTHDDQDDAIANWWLNGMNTWISWLIAQHKAAGFGGIGQELWVLHPSTGVRDRPHTDNGWKLEVAQGADPRRLMASYAHDNKVWPWSTWNNNTGSSTSETGMGSCVKLLQEAYRYNKLARFACENTGGESNSTGASTSMDGCFQVFTGTSADNATGSQGWLFNWLSYDALVSGAGATLTYYGTKIAANP